MYPEVLQSSLWHKDGVTEELKTLAEVKAGDPLCLLLIHRFTHLITKGNAISQALDKSVLFQISFSFVWPETSSKRSNSMIFLRTEIRSIDCLP